MLDLFTSPEYFIIRTTVLILALTVHEFAHAWVADRLGDPTPRLQGRISLNPLKHLDPIGTLAMLLTNFGWGKPVQIDPYNFKNPVKDSALVALAGPVVNIIMAVAFTVLAAALFFVSPALPFPVQMLVTLGMFVTLGILINVTLAVFNLVPVYPLDGSKIIVALLPKEQSLAYQSFMERFGFFVLIALIYPWGGGVSPISALVSPVIQFISMLLLSWHNPVMWPS